MNITEMLDKKAVTADLKSRDKEEVISELIDLMIEAGSVKKQLRDDLFKRILERENLGSTGIGKGVAIPHAKCPKITKMTSAFGISKEGIDFRSLDGEPTHIFFLLIAPGETPGPHLKALARISRLLDDKFVRDMLRSAKSPQEIFEVIKKEEQKQSR